MAHALQLFRNGLLPNALAQSVDAALRRGLRARTRERDDGHHRTGALDALTMRDLGVRREYQDYSSWADVPVFAARRLHRIADAARWGFPP